MSNLLHGGQYIWPVHLGSTSSVHLYITLTYGKRVIIVASLTLTLLATIF